MLLHSSPIPPSLLATETGFSSVVEELSASPFTLFWWGEFVDGQLAPAPLATVTRSLLSRASDKATYPNARLFCHSYRIAIVDE